jgi:hypothetical protein
LESTLAYAYYRSRDFTSARKYAQQALDDYKALKSPLQHEGVETQIENAREVLQWTDRWQKAGSDVVCSDLPRLASWPGKAIDKPVVRQLVVRSLKPLAVLATCDDPNVTQQPLEGWQSVDSGFYFQDIIQVSVDRAAFASNVCRTIAIHLAGGEGSFAAVVPLRIIVLSRTPLGLAASAVKKG